MFADVSLNVALASRLEGIHYSPRNRPLRWGKYVMAFV